MATADDWWVGGYIEAGASVTGGGTAYIPFVFQAATKANAEANDGAILLAGPFSSQNAAQNWANAYEKNPNTLHTGTTLPSGPGQPVTGSGTGPGGTGTEKGDSPPTGVLGGWLADITGFSGTNFVLRAVKVIVGGFLLIYGLTHLTGLNQIAGNLKTAVPLPV
jgi:hypothetical protein